MIKRILLIAAVAALAFAGFSLFAGRADATPAHEHDHETDYRDIPLTAQQVKTAGLSFGKAEYRSIDSTLAASGRIVLRAKDKGCAAALMGGIVRDIFVTDGQRVAKGQVVATIENPEVVSLQREYFTAGRECEFARLDMQRQQRLSANGAGVGRNLQEADKAYRVAEARMQGLAQQLRQLGVRPEQALKGHFVNTFPVKAPLAGTVGEITASRGSYADMQTPLMTIRNNAAVECDLDVFEKDLARIKVGDAVRLCATNEPSAQAEGRVYGINPYFTDGTKAVAVHVRLLSQSARLFDGQSVNGLISLGSRREQAVPSKAIVRADGKEYIFALNDTPAAARKQGYRFSRHEVTTGATSRGYTAVTFCPHIKDGQEIVTDNAFYLASLLADHGEH